VSIDGVPADQALKRRMEQLRPAYGYSSEHALRYDAVRGLLRVSRRGARVRVVLEDLDEKQQTVEVSAAFEYPRVWIQRLPVTKVGVDDEGDEVAWLRQGRLGYISIRVFRPGFEAWLGQAVESLAGSQGLIIDLRGNSGGGFDPKTAFRNFDPSDDVKGLPDRGRYRGPIAVLIDEGTTGAAEEWASWFAARKRARLFGTPTAGSASQTEAYVLSNGLYQVEVPVRASSGFLDRPIEGRGVEPDVEIRCDAQDLAQGCDTVEVAASRWLVETAGN
jgi:C-terminal processing protease CtpA/Prc